LERAKSLRAENWRSRRPVLLGCREVGERVIERVFCSARESTSIADPRYNTDVVRVLREAERTFGDRRLRLTLSLCDELPPEDQVSTAHCLGFDSAGRFLLARHVDRQWTIPGGHREAGESAEAALRRETLEEAAATIATPKVIAVERIDLLEGERDPRYTDPAFQVFYVAEVTNLAELIPNSECVESRLFDIDDARRQPGWIDHNQDLFEAAVDRWRARA
jgi:8-oxo-dGTP pyrophosphatase MutT (NUDIX family)